MNIPNKLTVLRLVLIPVFIAAVMIDFPFRFIVAAAVFAIAAITDTLDGAIARKYNMITDFGKLLDPLADKILVSAALICLICFLPDGLERNLMAIATVIIIAREFLVTSLRLLVASKGVVVPAGTLGKIKTTLQILAVIVILLELQFETVIRLYVPFVHILGYTLLALAVIATIVSCIQYSRAYAPYLDSKK